MGKKEGKKLEESTFLEKFLEGLIFFFVILAVVLRPFISGIRADLAGPMGRAFLNLTYEQEKSLHFFINAILCFAAVAFVLKNILKERFQTLRTAIDFPLLVLLILGWASLGWASQIQSSLMFALTWTSLILFFYVVANLASQGKGEKIILALIGVGIIFSVMAMIEVWQVYPEAKDLVGQHIGASQDNFMKQRFQSRFNAREAAGPFITSNILAGFLAILVPVILGMLMELWDRRQRPLLRIGTLVLALGALGIALLLTGSKGAWLALCVGLILFGILLFRQKIFASRKKTFLSALAASAILLGVIGGGTLWKGTGAWQKSLQVRSDYAHASWQMIKDHLFFGCGLNNYHSYYAAYKLPEADEMVFHAHNDYLQIWAELGIFGLFIYLWIWWAFWRKATKELSLEEHFNKGAKKKSKKQEEKDDQFLSREIWSSLLVTLTGVLALFGVHMFQVTLAGDPKIFGTLLVIWVVFSLLLTYPTQGDSPSQKRYNTSPARRYYLRIGILAGLGVFLFHSLGSFVLYSPGVFFLVLVLVAFLVGDHHQIVKEKKKETYLVDASLGLPSQLFLFLIFFLLIGVLLFGLQSTISSDKHIRQGDEFRQQFYKAKGVPEKSKLLKKALHEYIQAANLSPLDEKIPMAIAKVAEFLYTFEPTKENFKIAEDYYKAALYLAPRSYNVSYHFSIFYQKNPSFDPGLEQAQRLLEQAASNFPSQVRFRYELGKFYLKRAKKDQSLEYRQKAEREFKEAQILNKIVPLHYALTDGKGKKSEKLIEKALKDLYVLDEKKK